MQKFFLVTLYVGSLSLEKLKVGYNAIQVYEQLKPQQPLAQRGQVPPGVNHKSTHRRTGRHFTVGAEKIALKLTFWFNPSWA